MNESIFRKKSLDRVKSPEDLNDYMRVSTPGLWMLLGAVILLLLGALIWGIFGRLETKVNARVVVADGVAGVFINQEDSEQVSGSVQLVLDEESYSFETVSPWTGERVVTEAGVFCGSVPIKGDIGNGIYESEIILETLAPISFVLN